MGNSGMTIAPCYPSSGGRGQPSIGLGRMYISSSSNCDDSTALDLAASLECLKLLRKAALSSMSLTERKAI